jgi:release factor glutamine methyltransferase
MEIPNNTLEHAINYFKKELYGVYNKSELGQLLQIAFSHYLNLNRIDLALTRHRELTDQDLKNITHVVNELKQHKPLAQIIGVWEFFGISIKINEHTLIPRPETEELVQLIMNENSHPASILDIGTGSGCIAIALKSNFLKTEVYALDVSKEALKIAKSNAMTNKLEIIFNKQDILKWEDQDKEYDVIVSNPPYITQKEKTLMNKNVLDYEPHLALFVENDTPLLFYNAIAEFAVRHLAKNGKLYFEINEFYGNEVKCLLSNKKFKNINIVKDINEKDRIVSCTKD